MWKYVQNSSVAGIGYFCIWKWVCSSSKAISIGCCEERLPFTVQELLVWSCQHSHMFTGWQCNHLDPSSPQISCESLLLKCSLFCSHLCSWFHAVNPFVWEGVKRHAVSEGWNWHAYTFGAKIVVFGDLYCQGKVGRWVKAYHLRVPPPPMPPPPPRGNGPRQRLLPTPRGVNMIVWSLDNRFVLAAIMGRYLFLFFCLGFLAQKWTKSIFPFL